MITQTMFCRLVLMLTLTVYATQGCNKKSNPASSTKVETTNTSSTEKEKEPVLESSKNIKGSVMFTYDYCGGAAPSDEMIKRLRTPRAISNYTLYIKAGVKNNDTPILDSSNCNEQGQFSFKVKPGKYVILTPDQIKTFSTKNYTSKYLQVDDEQCLKQWWEDGLHKVNVANDNVTLADTILHQRCNGLGLVPCMSFTGPLPPMMRRE